MTEDEPHPEDTLVELAETLAGPRGTPSRSVGSAVLAGRYQILSLVGQGGMGNVYRVHDHELDEVVALKTLHDDLAQSELAIGRFRAEVKLARRVTHQNVARTFDIGTAGGTTFLTMEYVDGQALDDVLRAQRWLSPSRVVEIALEICAGLDAAHHAGVFHLDLKPANVLIEAAGRIVISDFGIARARDAAESTVPKFQGTPAYMAPEQVRGVGPFDGRTDLYALGVMLFEMLTGELPFQGPTALATALARMMEPVPELPDRVPVAIAAVVRRCLETDPEQRFASARELGEALRAALQQVESGAHEVPTAPRGLTEPGMIVVVLPLTTAETADETIAHGFAEAIADELSAVRGIRVRPVTTPTDDPIGAGRQFNAQVVVHGVVSTDGDRLDVRLKASSTAEGFRLWSEQYSGSTRDVFTLAATASRAIAQAVTATAPPPRSALTDPVTIDLYMRARTMTRAQWHTNAEAARPLWERLIERASDDPRVLAGAASYFSRLEHLRLLSAGFGHDAGTESFAERANQYATAAIEAAPQWPEPYCARAVIHFNQYDFAGSLADALRALDLAPGYAEAQTHAGRIMLEVGPLDEALALLQQAHDVDPQQYNARWELVRGRGLQRDWDAVDALIALPVTEADQRFMRFILMTRMDMWRPTPRYLDEPLTDLDRDHRLPFYVPTVRHVLRYGELPEEVRELEKTLDSFQQRYPRNAANASQHATEVSMQAGNPERALEHLKRCDQWGLRDLMWLEHCPMLDGHRDHPTFVEVLDNVRERTEPVRQARNRNAV